MRLMRSLSVILGEGVQDIDIGETKKFVDWWSRIAWPIEKKVRYSNVDGKTSTALLGLEWKLIIDLNIYRGRNEGHKCVCEVSMTYPMQTTDGGKVRVPLHTVQFELVDTETIHWQGNAVLLTGPEIPAIKQIAEALSFGEITVSEGPKKKLHFRRNWFPVIKRIFSK